MNMPSGSSSPPPDHPKDRRRAQLILLHHYVRALVNEWAPHPVAACSVEFRPYAGFRNVVQLRDGRISVRLSDLLADAPWEVVQAVVDDLLARLFGRPPLPEARKIKAEFLEAPETRDRFRRLRRERSRLKMAPPAGEVWDLQRRFERLNRAYFAGALQLDGLGWSLRRERSRLGRYDPDLNAVVLNRVLDSPLVPDYVVDYVLYHELIHAYLWQTIPEGPGRSHGPEFKRWEQRFPELRRARAFLQRHFSRD
ncbi:MAG: hypothetical protein Kow00109_29050 [Acidobacteriota bacterium]